MKVLDKKMVKKRNQIKHTKDERDILTIAKSPFIVELYYAFQTTKKLFFIMEFVNGGELFYHLRREMKFSEGKTRFYSAEIILGIEYLHKHNIIYRDLKPENVLLDLEGHIKLSDFGLSKKALIEKDKSFKTYTFCGTPEYLAPEIIKKEGHDKSVDWWSLGALMYDMLSGRPPFFNHNRSEMLKNIVNKDIEMKEEFSDEAISLLSGLLCRNPSNRLGSSIEDSEDIKKHPFFASIDWTKLLNKEIKPPFRPSIKGTKEKDIVKYIDPEFLNDNKFSLKNENAEIEMSANSKFEGFTYVSEPELKNNENL